MIRTILSILLSTLLILPGVATAASIWKVSKGDSALYIAIDLYFLDTTNFPLPPEFTDAFNSADRFVLQDDIEGFWTYQYSNGSSIIGYR